MTITNPCPTTSPRTVFPIPEKSATWNGERGLSVGTARYIGEFQEGLRDGKGFCVLPNGDMYSGEWIYDQLNGNGIMTYSNGCVYDGEWVNDKKQGKGKCSFPEGHMSNDAISYECQWLNDVPVERHVVVVYKDHRTYDGGLLNGLPHGVGKITDAAGKLIYRGEYEKGLYHGNGELRTNNSYTREGIDITFSYYTGNFVAGKKQGFGTEITGDRNDPSLDIVEEALSMPPERAMEYYQGQWIEDKEHGQGTFRFYNGDVYQGEVENRLKHGYGTYRWANGGVYIGEWFADKRHSYGIMNHPWGGFKAGRWEQNIFQPNEDIDYPDGFYSGQIYRGQKDGLGYRKWSNGSSYDGQWKNDQRHGHGKFVWPGVCTYDGEWYQDQKNGQGKMTWPDGSSYEGEWKKDQQHGFGIYKDKDGKTLPCMWEEDRFVGASMAAQSSAQGSG